MTGRIEGAELCHRIDAAKQLVKYGSKDAAEFLAKYKGVPCGHSINGRPDPADPCSAEERSLVAVTLNAPATLTRDFLTVLSGIDEFLMARLIRAQTVDGVTIIEFLDDVMQDRTDGFKTHHRIAAAKELIVHIVRDEQPEAPPLPRQKPSFPRKREPRGAAGAATPQLPGSNPLSPRERVGVRVTQPSFPRKREPRGAAWLDPARLEHMLSSTQSSFPRKREPRGAAGPVAPQPTPLTLTLPKGDPGRQSSTAPKTTHPNTAAPGRKRHGRHSQKGPGVRAHRGGKGRKTRTRGVHPRRAQNQRKTQTALARTGPLGRTNRLHTPRPLTPLVTPTQPQLTRRWYQNRGETPTSSYRRKPVSSPRLLSSTRTGGGGAIFIPWCAGRNRHGWFPRSACPELAEEPAPYSIRGRNPEGGRAGVIPLFPHLGGRLRWGLLPPLPRRERAEPALSLPKG